MATKLPTDPTAEPEATVFSDTVKTSMTSAITTATASSTAQGEPNGSATSSIPVTSNFSRRDACKEYTPGCNAAIFSTDLGTYPAASTPSQPLLPITVRSGDKVEAVVDAAVKYQRKFKWQCLCIFPGQGWVVGDLWDAEDVHCQTKEFLHEMLTFISRDTYYAAQKFAMDWLAAHSDRKDCLLDDKTFMCEPGDDMAFIDKVFVFGEPNAFPRTFLWHVAHMARMIMLAGRDKHPATQRGYSNQWPPELLSSPPVHTAAVQASLAAIAPGPPHTFPSHYSKHISPTDSKGNVPGASGDVHVRNHKPNKGKGQGEGSSSTALPISTQVPQAIHMWSNSPQLLPPLSHKQKGSNPAVSGQSSRFVDVPPHTLPNVPKEVSGMTFIPGTVSEQQFYPGFRARDVGSMNIASAQFPMMNQNYTQQSCHIQYPQASSGGDLSSNIPYGYTNFPAHTGPRGLTPRRASNLNHGGVLYDPYNGTNSRFMDGTTLGRDGRNNMHDAYANPHHQSRRLSTSSNRPVQSYNVNDQTGISSFDRFRTASSTSMGILGKDTAITNDRKYGYGTTWIGEENTTVQELYAGDLPDDVRSDEVQKMFEEVVHISPINITVKRAKSSSGQPHRAQAFITFSNHAETKIALEIRKLNPTIRAGSVKVLVRVSNKFLNKLNATRKSSTISNPCESSCSNIAIASSIRSHDNRPPVTGNSGPQFSQPLQQPLTYSPQDARSDLHVPNNQQTAFDISNHGMNPCESTSATTYSPPSKKQTTSPTDSIVVRKRTTVDINQEASSKSPSKINEDVTVMVDEDGNGSQIVASEKNVPMGTLGQRIMSNVEESNDTRFDIKAARTSSCPASTSNVTVATMITKPPATVDDDPLASHEQSGNQSSHAQLAAENPSTWVEEENSETSFTSARELPAATVETKSQPSVQGEEESTVHDAMTVNQKHKKSEDTNTIDPMLVQPNSLSFEVLTSTSVPLEQTMADKVQLTSDKTESLTMDKTASGPAADFVSVTNIVSTVEAAALKANETIAQKPVAIGQQVISLSPFARPSKSQQKREKEAKKKQQKKAGTEKARTLSLTKAFMASATSTSTHTGRGLSDIEDQSAEISKKATKDSEDEMHVSQEPKKDTKGQKVPASSSPSKPQEGRKTIGHRDNVSDNWTKGKTGEQTHDQGRTPTNSAATVTQSSRFLDKSQKALPAAPNLTIQPPRSTKSDSVSGKSSAALQVDEDALNSPSPPRDGYVTAKQTPNVATWPPLPHGEEVAGNASAMPDEAPKKKKKKSKKKSKKPEGSSKTDGDATVGTFDTPIEQSSINADGRFYSLDSNITRYEAIMKYSKDPNNPYNYADMQNRTDHGKSGSKNDDMEAKQEGKKSGPESSIRRQIQAYIMEHSNHFSVMGPQQ